MYTLIGANELKLVSSGKSCPLLNGQRVRRLTHDPPPLPLPGSGGLDEMEDEWSDGKVMWGFVRVKDANSGLPKFVLINWVSPRFPLSR